MQSNESLGVLRLIFLLSESSRLGHGPCQTFIESCPQGVLQTERIVIQPESSGWVRDGYALANDTFLYTQRLQKLIYSKTHFAQRIEEKSNDS